MEEYVLVSLFDGYSGAYEAAKRVKSLKISKCYASEIDKHAIKISKKNHPEIIHLGDVRDLVYSSDVPESTEKDIILIGGSPCQDLSIAGKRAGLKGEQSGLFFEYVRALEELKPKYFIFENVASMKNSDRDTISNILGVEPIMIDSALVSAQRRRRYYWTNIKGVQEPKDKKINLKDIVHENTWADRDKVSDIIKKYIVPFDKTLKILDKETQRGKVGYFGTNSQGQRVYNIHGKSVTLSASGGRGAKTGLYLFGCITPDRINKIEGYIRKLTPVECERLQTLPDGYTEGVSDTQRYKMLGNGFTVDVIAHILSFIPIQDLL